MFWSTVSSVDWETISATSGAVTRSEDLKHSDDVADGSLSPKPPRRVGSASRALSVDEQGGCPVSAEIRC